MGLIFDLVLQPFPLVIILLGLGLLRLWWVTPKPVGTWRWVAACYVLLWLDTCPLMASLSTRLWESQIPRREHLPDDARALIVLGGEITRPTSAGDPSQLGESTRKRLDYALQLHRQRPEMLIVVCGGHLAIPEPHLSAADQMALDLIDRGVPEAKILRETTSRNTVENASFARRLLDDQQLSTGLVLVTQGFHIPRATRIFRKAGLDVTPMGCDYRTDRLRPQPWDLFPKSAAAGFHHEVFHEIVSTVVWWSRGKL